MKNYIYTAIGAVIVSVGLIFAGYALAPKANPTLGGYNPPVQSYAGFLHTFSTSTVLATTDFCGNANTEWLNESGSAATGTVPAATSTYAACSALNNLGASVSGNIMNESTNTVAYLGGTGVTFKCETTGVGTSTVAPGGTCTATGFTLLASSTVNYQVFFDTSSSSLIFLVGNNYK